VSDKKQGPWLPFHKELVRCLRELEPDTWEWFEKRQDDEVEREAIRLELLKHSVRLDRADEPDLYQWVDLARERLGFDQQVVLYRAQNYEQLNCSVVGLGDAAHLVFYGPIEEQLEPDEFLAVIGHELGHAELWRGESGAFLIAEQILDAWAQEPQASGSWLETLRLHRLYAEIFCDRAGYRASQDLPATVGSLVKLETGAKSIRPLSYLKQAEEILSSGSQASRGESHPETYLRALALQWWTEDASDEVDRRLEKLIEGVGELTSLSVSQQPQWQQWTRGVLVHLLDPAWRKTDLTQAHARLFFDTEIPPIRSAAPLSDLDVQIQSASESMLDYACYLLLDFVSCDRQIQEVAMAQSLEWSRRWRCESRFQDLARRELRLRKSQIDALQKESVSLLEKAEKQASGVAGRESGE
jgi:hypothetical protein